ncbi:unnamed protein product [Leptidea sinapis]|uniref:Uncharacterized protein n=1 Tax=Leptidea sinapis TaxID=189913 RepID=A0A5E4QJM1_9NEOP|nr:unnamed protein product [Leptidea sinapis]
MFLRPQWVIGILLIQGFLVTSFPRFLPLNPLPMISGRIEAIRDAGRNIFDSTLGFRPQIKIPFTPYRNIPLIEPIINRNYDKNISNDNNIQEKPRLTINDTETSVKQETDLDNEIDSSSESITTESSTDTTTDIWLH